LGSNREIKSARSGATLQISCHLSLRVSKVSAAAMKKIIYHHSALPKMGYHHFDHFWSRSTTPRPFCPFKKNLLVIKLLEKVKTDLYLYGQRSGRFVDTATVQSARSQGSRQCNAQFCENQCPDFFAPGSLFFSAPRPAPLPTLCAGAGPVD
jgi:hypothetical protein